MHGQTILELDPMKVREARPADAPDIVRLTRHLAAEHGETAERFTTVALAEALWSRQPLLHALVAEVHGRVAGSLLYSVGYSTFSARPRIWIEDMIVSPQNRRLGVGAALLAALRARAAEHGVVEMLGLVSSGNPCGQAFWTDAGSHDKPGWALVSVPVVRETT